VTDAPGKVPDPLAEVRIEFAAGLDGRVQGLHDALQRLESGFGAEDAERLHRAAHALAGTAGSFGATRLAQAARELEQLVAGWRDRGEAPPDEWRRATATLTSLAAAARAYEATAPTRPVTSAAARLAVAGELASLINVTNDLHEIFQAAILKVRRVLAFRRASVVLVDDTREHYYLHTLFDSLQDGFVALEQRFPLAKGLTGEVIRTGRPVRENAHPGTRGIHAEAGRRVSAMIVPLRLEGQVIGALNFGHEESEQYTEADLEWAAVLARQIETSLHYSKLLTTIARQKNQLEALIGASDAAIMLVGPDGVILYANAEMARLIGVQRPALRSIDLEVVHELLGRGLTDRRALEAQQRALAGHEPLRDVVEFSGPRRAIYQRVVAPVGEAGGGRIGHIVLYRDVTLEAEADRLKSEFVSVVSHELRTPMTSVKASLGLLLGGAAGALEPTARELLEIALRNADRLIRLVNDLLDLSRIRAGRLDLTPEPVALADPVRAALETLRATAAEQGVRLETTPSPEPLDVMGVPDRLEQLVVNLVSNAVKFSPPGGAVAIRWWRDKAAAILEVADQGAGIPAERLHEIFEPFRQLDSSMTRQHGGAGLGLAICEGIVQALNGHIWAESEPGKGARFYVRLPLASSPPT